MNVFGLLFSIPLLIVSIIHIYGERKDNRKIRYITKPLLMPLIILMYIFAVNPVNISWFIIIALVFGTLGDIFLMLPNEDKWFIFGMGSFLFNQIFYIVSFFVANTNIGLFPITGFFLFVPTGILFYYLLPAFLPKLNKDLKIPVVIYICAILLMHISATLTLGTFTALPVLLLYIGSISFIISDGLIVINKFGREIEKARELIMSTYILAQFFIALGMIISSY